MNQVVAHDQGAFHEQSAHSESIGLDLFDLLQHFRYRNLDAEVMNFVAVIGADDVDKVFAYVVHIALDGRQNQNTFSRTGTRLFHIRFEVGDCCFHGLGRLQDERQLHLARSKEFADYLHAIKKNVVDNGQWCQTLSHSGIKISSETFTITVNDALLEQLFDRPVTAVLAYCGHIIDVSEYFKQFFERVIVSGASIVDEV